MVTAHAVQPGGREAGAAAHDAGPHRSGFPRRRVQLARLSLLQMVDAEILARRDEHSARDQGNPAPSAPVDADQQAYLTTATRNIIEMVRDNGKHVTKVLSDLRRFLCRTWCASQSPKTFRDFLLSAPYMFLELGEKMGAISHIVSFWRYRFPKDRTLAGRRRGADHHLPGLHQRLRRAHARTKASVIAPPPQSSKRDCASKPDRRPSQRRVGVPTASHCLATFTVQGTSLAVGRFVRTPHLKDARHEDPSFPSWPRQPPWPPRFCPSRPGLGQGRIAA